ncbi:hypothetical protein COT97_02390 [Candidatus Falkowbacteria bacterium CG10_big_fil_rev_8_21_14_0_10_39_11]|uniref:EamA domain-containing protein n=1 Tax=Candidatus Falkowbacteria bacterium CG10_big_fil_rev_8_21_14_0_10_39_11 TaxID=1974565 RepID=A0A2H0V5H6_9BACT|nr:MAG: hypothetical protein COT97_02390 [Candidatus Falkowbacteria bacterium CG10_big_fil_rev_8_21_14_0_10_39_11]
MKSNSAAAYLFKFLAVLFGASEPSIFMLAIEDIPVELGVMYFCLFGGFLMFVINFLLAKNKRCQIELLIKEVRTKSVFVRLSLIALATSVLYVCYTLAMKNQTVTETVLVIRMAPLFAIVFALIVLREKVRSWYLLILSFVLGFVGVLFIQDLSSLSIDSLLSYFMILALVAALLLALSNVLMRQLDQTSALKKNMIVSLYLIMAGCLVLVYNLMIGLDEWGISVKQVFYFIYVGVFTLAIPSILNLKAYELLNSFSRLAFWDYFMPVGAMIFAYFLNKEVGFDYAMLAFSFVLITVAAILADRSIEKTKQTKEAS